MTILNLKKRPCKLGSGLNPRTEKHGDEDVPACDFSIEGVMLDAAELDELLCDSTASDRLFDRGGPLPEPAFRGMKSFVLKAKYEKSTVNLVVGLNESEIKLGGVKLAKVTLAPQTGGLTELSLQVQCNPEAEQLALLYTFMAKDADVAIRFGREETKAAKTQPELPLGHESNPVVVPADPVH